MESNGHLQIIGLGMASLDIIVRGDLKKSSAIQELVIDGGGMACNAMAAAQKLGAATGFIGTFGSDKMGRLKLQALRESGVDAGGTVVRDAPDDWVVMVQIDPLSGERNFYPVASPRRKDLGPHELDQAYLTQADYLLVDGIHPAAALQAAAWMRSTGKKVMLDANITHGPPSDEIRALVRATNILICSAGFLQALTGSSELLVAARQTLALGPQIVVQTNGEHGSDTFSGAEGFHTPAYRAQVVDTSGAGDVFHGAFLVGLLQGWDLRKIAAFSSAAAALKCMQMGRAGYPGMAETLGWMEQVL
jgi:sulfofructose kinase